MVASTAYGTDVAIAPEVQTQTNLASWHTSHDSLHARDHLFRMQILIHRLVEFRLM